MKIGMTVKEFRPERFKRTYMWEVLLPDVGIIPGFAIGRYCQDVQFGDYGMQEVDRVKYGPFRAGYAGAFEVTEVTMTFLLPSPDVVSAYFYAWRDIVISKGGAYFPKGNYAKSINAILYDTAGEEVDRFKLRGAFPKTLPTYDLAYSSEDVIKAQIKFNVDVVERF